MRGIGTYLRGLLDGYRVLGVAGDVRLLLESGPPLPEDLRAAGFEAHPARLRPLNRHVRPLLDPLQVRRAIAALLPDVYHAVEYAQPIAPAVPVVVTVHDLIPFVLPADYPWMRRERWLPMHQFARADAVIAVSQSTADDLRRIAGVDPARITVVAEGVAPPADAVGRRAGGAARAAAPAAAVPARGGDVRPAQARRPSRRGGAPRPPPPRRRPRHRRLAGQLRCRRGDRPRGCRPHRARARSRTRQRRGPRRPVPGGRPAPLHLRVRGFRAAPSRGDGGGDPRRRLRQLIAARGGRRGRPPHRRRERRGDGRRGGRAAR